MIDGAWIMITGSLVAVACSLLGCFLILRKMAMVGDAISHSVLPGIVIAFLITRSFNSIPMILGAAAFGMLCTFFIEYISRKGRMQTDAAIGVTFSFLFAVGVILVSQMGNVHIDEDCLLYGDLLNVDLDMMTVLGMEIPRSTVMLLLNLMGILALVVIGFRGLYFTTFDSDFAEVLGFNTGKWHYLLMTGVSFCTVVSFDSVGVILVVAFLVGPPSIAYLLTHDFRRMMWYSVAIAICSSILGYQLSVWLDSSPSAAMVVVLGVLFAMAFILNRLGGSSLLEKSRLLPRG